MCIYKFRLYETCCHRGAPSDLELCSACPKNCNPVAPSSTDIAFVGGRCPDCKAVSPEPSLPPLRDFAYFSSTTGLHDDSGIAMPPSSSPSRSEGFDSYCRPHTYAPRMEMYQSVPDAPKKTRRYRMLDLDYGVLESEEGEEEEEEDEDPSPCPRRMLLPPDIWMMELESPRQEEFRRPATPDTPTPMRFRTMDLLQSPAGGKGSKALNGLSRSCTPGSSPLLGKGGGPFMWA